MTAAAASICTADEALARLKEGDERFVNGEARFPTVPLEVLADLARGQQPYATVLGCSDSRVPPELVFGAGHPLATVYSSALGGSLAQLVEQRTLNP